MRKIYLCLFALLLSAYVTNAAQFTVTISGFTYSPANTNAAVGDTINFPASGFHPLVQVDQSTWNANGNTPSGSGWGVKTSNYMHVITTAGDIYFVCQNHVGSGMKGKITVTASHISEWIGTNNIKLLSNVVKSQTVTVLNTTDGAGVMNVYDLAGKHVSEITLSNAQRQEVVLDIPKGVYIYRFNMEGNWTSSEKLYIGGDF